MGAGSSFGSRDACWIPICCALLALIVRCATVPAPGDAAPWLDGARALQGLRNPGEVGPLRTDLVVAAPLIVAQHAGWLATRATGGDPGLSEGAWARKQEGFGRAILFLIWLGAAVGCAWFAARALPGGWGALAGAMTAIVPVGIGGTTRLEPWSLAAFFLIAALVARRRWIAVPAWGAAISLAPVGIVAATAILAVGRKEDRIAILASLPIWLALDPTRLTAPQVAIPRYFAGLITGGWPGIGDGAQGRLLVASWTPGPAVALFGLAGIPALLHEKDARYRAAAACVALLWIVPAILGARRPDGLGLVFPLAFALAAYGARAVAAHAVHGRTAVAVALGAIAIAPVLLGDFTNLRAQTTRRARAGDLARVLREEVGATGLLLRDPLAPAVSDSIATFTLPTHVGRPEAFDLAWWPGWYGSFSHALITVRTAEEIQRDRADRPASMAFLAALARHADRVRAIGDPDVDRSALLLFRLRPGPPWTPEDRLTRWEGMRGGKSDARFLSDLAGFLSLHGKADVAVDLLRLALRWDEGSPRILSTLGSTLLSMGEWKEAIEAIEPTLRANPGLIEMRFILARAYLAGNVPGRAETELRQVLTARPDFAAAHYEMARAAAAAGDWAIAAAALETYLAKEPNPVNRPQIEEALADARRRAADLEEKKRKAAVRLMKEKP